MTETQVKTETGIISYLLVPPFISVSLFSSLFSLLLYPSFPFIIISTPFHYHKKKNDVWGRRGYSFIITTEQLSLVLFISLRRSLMAIYPYLFMIEHDIDRR